MGAHNGARAQDEDLKIFNCIRLIRVPMVYRLPIGLAIGGNGHLRHPKPKNPVSDVSGKNCAEGQGGPVWFLAGTYRRLCG